MVNIHPDGLGRTLLAWRGLMVMLRFMPGSPIPLHVTIRQRREVTEDHMNSIERKENRYRRRSEARAAKKAARLKKADNFDVVFSFENLYRSYRCCRRGVSWKASVQRYIEAAPRNLAKTYERLQAGTYRSPGFFEFDLCERGKLRHIRSTIISERVVQRCLCDNALVPALTPSFIYDNGASLAGKGYHFAVRRLERHLRSHFRKYGREGYVLLYDFSKFFDNVSHALLREIFDKTFTDERTKRLVNHFVDAFGDVGLGLGSQISQVLALASANRLDHYVKEILRIRAYCRYMDDGILVHISKEKLKECVVAIRKICDELHITLNRKKTQIVKLSRGFTWLKARFFITPTGKIIRKICKTSVVHARRRIKHLARLYEAGKCSFADAYNSVASWTGYAMHFDAHNSIKSIWKLFNNLFVWRRDSYVHQDL